MTDSIGSAAGAVWTYLSESGAVSATKIAKDTGLDAKLVQRAIGWLAKEDKLSFEVKGRNEVIGLK
jgi:predicted regulator of amino acid metabolism with ACT domain